MICLMQCIQCMTHKVAAISYHTYNVTPRYVFSNIIYPFDFLTISRNSDILTPHPCPQQTFSITSYSFSATLDILRYQLWSEFPLFSFANTSSRERFFCF